MKKLVFGSEESREILRRDGGFNFDLRDLDPLGYSPLPEREIEQESEPYCTICGAPMEWVDCWNCGGEGGRDGDDLMEEDPMWYDEDDWEDCDICRGKGGYWECINLPHEKTKEAQG